MTLCLNAITRLGISCVAIAALAACEQTSNPQPSEPTSAVATAPSTTALTPAAADSAPAKTADPAPGKTDHPAPKKKAPARAAAPADKVVAYYFHGNRRCRTCINMQAAIVETINERFSAELAAGTLAFREVNIDEPAQRHFVGTFQLSFSTLVVAAMKGIDTVKWENAEKVWQHARNPAALKDYTEQRVRAHLALVGNR